MIRPTNVQLISREIFDLVNREECYPIIKSISFEGKDLKDSDVESIEDEIFTVYFIMNITHFEGNKHVAIEASRHAESLYKYNKTVYDVEICNIAALESKLPKSEYWTA